LLASGLIIDKEKASSFRQIDRENLSQRQSREITPYENVIHAIDNNIGELDRIKIQIEVSLMK